MIMRLMFLLYLMSLLALLSSDPVFGVLAPDFVSRHVVALDASFDIAGLRFLPFPVPGKVPLFLEQDVVEIGHETEMTVGLVIEAGGRRVVYVPGCAAVSETVLSRIAGADALLFDGTTFTDGEMVELGLSPKTAARMGHLAMSGPGGSIAGLAGVDVATKVFVHINNTNPVLVEGSPERRVVEGAGWTVAYDGQEIVL